MKILFFVDRLRRGGIQTLLYNLTCQFVKMEDVSIDYLLFQDTMAPDLELEMIEMGCKVFKVRKPTNLVNTLRCCKELNDFFKKNHDYDLIHTHTSTKAVLPLYFAKKHGIKHRIQHAHSSGFMSENKFTILIGNILKVPVCRLANDYFACSEVAADWMFGGFYARKDIQVKIFKNGIDPEKFVFNNLVRNEVRNELDIPEGCIVIGHVGRFTWVKNHGFLIKVFNEYHRNYPNSILVLVGIGEMKEEIEQKVKQLGIYNSVKFLGQRLDVNRLYQAFDVFLMPSIFEGLPFVGIEAQMSGLPCLFSSTISNEVKVLESTSFLNLECNISDWVEELNKKSNSGIRKDTTLELTNAGFNIVFEAAKLYKYYYEKING